MAAPTRRADTGSTHDQPSRRSTSSGATRSGKAAPASTMASTMNHVRSVRGTSMTLSDRLPPTGAAVARPPRVGCGARGPCIISRHDVTPRPSLQARAVDRARARLGAPRGLRGPGQTRARQGTPAETVDCKKGRRATCVAVVDDCCPCSEGGKQRAIPKKGQSSYEKDRHKRCEGTACTEVMSQDATCSQQAFCAAGICELRDAPAPIALTPPDGGVIRRHRETRLVTAYGPAA